MHSEKSFENIDTKIEKLDKKIATLQDLILKMKVNFELIARGQITTNTNMQLIETVEDLTNNFLNNRPSDCEIINKCTTKIQKSVMKVLKLYSEKGYYRAREIANEYINSLDSYLEKGICRDKPCLNNIKLIFTEINDFLKTTKQNSLSQTKELLNLDSELDLFEGNEKAESKAMSVLGNEHRLKILKELSKGSKYYSQLERIVGLKGGQFNFHLSELRDANFIEPRQDDKAYSITRKGLKALKMLFELTNHS